MLQHNHIAPKGRAIPKPNEKESWEKHFVSRFLTLQSINFAALQSVSEYCGNRHVAGPDVKATIDTAAGPIRVGIELALYSSDADKKVGSVSLRCARVRECLRQQLMKHLSGLPELDRFQIRVLFRCREDSLQKDECRRIAQEMSNLLGSALAIVQGVYSFDPFYDTAVFSTFPTLQKFISRIEICPNFGSYRGTDGWFDDPNGDWAGIESERVSDRIAQHDTSKYDLADVQECWLVIYSTGHGGSAARTKEEERKSLASESIVSAAAKSGFDRIYFWCQEFNWAALLSDSARSRSII